MSSKKTGKYILAIAVALLLPLSCYLLARVLSKDKIELPSYYIKEGVEERVVDGKKVTDTLYHRVMDIVLTNQLGEQVSVNEDLKDRILVVDFIFTRCPTVCPKLTGNMGLLQRAFRKNDTTVHLLSFTVDPAYDTPAVLRAYADAHHVNHDDWWFLTGDRKQIYNYARNELHLSLQPGNGGADDFIHTEKIVLIDKQRFIRGYYDGLDSADIKRCADDIVLLTLEKKRKRK